MASPFATGGISLELSMLVNQLSIRAVGMRLMLALVLVSAPANSQSLGGTFDKINSEVRQPNTGSSSSSPSETTSSLNRKREGKEWRNSRDHHHEYSEDDDDNDNQYS